VVYNLDMRKYLLLVLAQAAYPWAVCLLVFGWIAYEMIWRY